MRAHYLIMYDITDNKRLQKVHKICKGYGESIQFSVFYAQLSKQDLEIFKTKVHNYIKEEDQILFIKLKPVIKGNDPFKGKIESLGRKFEINFEKEIVIF